MTITVLTSGQVMMIMMMMMVMIIRLLLCQTIYFSPVSLLASSYCCPNRYTAMVPLCSVNCVDSRKYVIETNNHFREMRTSSWHVSFYNWRESDYVSEGLNIYLCIKGKRNTHREMYNESNFLTVRKLSGNPVRCRKKPCGNSKISTKWHKMYSATPSLH